MATTTTRKTSATRKTSNAAQSTAAQVALTATIRTMIICVPDAVPTEALASSRQLDKHFGVKGATVRRFWALPLSPWRRRHMIDLCKGRPAYCAGGPVGLLDLQGLRHAAAMGAGVRHQQWTHVVRGTAPATAAPVFVRKHLAEPCKYPLERARADFEAQPRVQAMLMHNAAVYGAARLDTAELEMFQAGCVAYQHFHALQAICGDAMPTAEGHRIAPASDQFADRIRYLDQARSHLDTLDASARLLAVSL
ncbi:MAG: hypothetical protein ACRDT6_13105 [Micromonosporaceae bacterium]